VFGIRNCQGIFPGRVKRDVVRFGFNREGFHRFLRFADASAVITFITSVRNTSKWTVQKGLPIFGFGLIPGQAFIGVTR
jgi:hypothetical protein